ncbi:MAG: phosphotransferase [Anaerolineales bacterium]|nr:phosphotransferase [Anaerolineales bacterium]
MNLPHKFIQTVESVFAEDGKEFIKKLPQYIEEVSLRWNLREIRPVDNLSFNFVAYATSPLTPLLLGEGNNVVLKIGVPREELISEVTALKFYAGNGACKLIESDEEKGFLLLERLKPGKMLSELKDDDERTQIGMDVMQNLESASLLVNSQEQAPAIQKFIKLSDWFDGLKNIRPHYGGTGPFPKEILERVESVLPELFADENVLLHGDFHHFNILSSERGWLIIDPKGVIGPAGYEIGPLMLNPWLQPMDWSQFKTWSKRRVDIIKERTGWEKEVIINWALSHAILSAWWNFESDIEDEHSLTCAKIFSEIK